MSTTREERETWRVEALNANSFLTFTGQPESHASHRIIVLADALDRVEALIDGLCTCGNETCSESAWRAAIEDALRPIRDATGDGND